MGAKRLAPRLSPDKKRALRILVVVTFMMIGAAALFYWLSYGYVLKRAEDNITNLLLSHKGIHHYIQNTLLPAYANFQDEGEIAETFYAPELLSSSYIVRNQHVFYNQERKAAALPELYYKLAAKSPAIPSTRPMPWKRNSSRCLTNIGMSSPIGR